MLQDHIWNAHCSRSMFAIWDLFSQNDRQVAMELKKIWFIENVKNQ